MRSRSVGLGCLVAIAIAAAGCGGDDDGGDRARTDGGGERSGQKPRAGVLWRGEPFCAKKTLNGDAGACRGAAWDVAGCVDEPHSLRRVGDAAARFEVHQGDQGAGGGGDRCELVEQTRPITGMAPAPGEQPIAGGEVRTFAFEARYDKSLQRPTNRQYQTLAQWHHSTRAPGCGGSSPIKIAVSGQSGAKRLEVHGQQCVRGVRSKREILYRTPLRTGSWQSWRFEVKWSADPKVGYVEFEHDGDLVRKRMATRYSGPAGTPIFNHFKVGNYRDKTIAFPTVVEYRNVRIGL